MLQRVLVASISIVLGLSLLYWFFSRDRINPETIYFSGREYQVIKQTEILAFMHESDTFYSYHPEDMRGSEPCAAPVVVNSDVNHDGSKDVIIFFCNMAKVYLDKNVSISSTNPLFVEYTGSEWKHLHNDTISRNLTSWYGYVHKDTTFSAQISTIIY